MNNSAFLIMFIALTAMMALVPFILRRVEIPPVISLLIVGMIIGPAGFDLIGELSSLLSFLGTPGDEAHVAAQIKATSKDFSMLINSLGSLGLMFLMALAGMEADFKLIKSVRKPVILLSIMTFCIPAAAGYLVYRHFEPGNLAGKLLYASLFASHSVGIVFPVIRELKLSRSRFGASVLISTIITDIASIILLAVSVQLYRQSTNISHMIGQKTLSIFDHVSGNLWGNSFIAVFLLIVIIYLTLTILSVGFLGKKLIKYFNPGEDILITLILTVILCAVLIGEIFGINLVVGAFIAGLGLSQIVHQNDMLLFRRFESIGYGFLIPFLFVSIGMNTDFSVFKNFSGFSVVLLTVVALVGSKMISGFFSLRICGFGNSTSLAAGLMTVPQLSATLAAAAIGKSMGILNPLFFNAIVILSIVTTLPVPTLVKLILKRSPEKFRNASTFKVPHVVKDNDLL